MDMQVLSYQQQNICKKLNALINYIRKDFIHKSKYLSKRNEEIKEMPRNQFLPKQIFQNQYSACIINFPAYRRRNSVFAKVGGDLETDT